MNANREPGFYWVKPKPLNPYLGQELSPHEWQVAEWIQKSFEGPHWLLPGIEDNYQDREFEKIDEQQIIRLTDN